MTRPDERRGGTEQDPGTWLLNKIDARESALTGQIERIRAEIDALTARLCDLDEAIEHLRITRKTLLALAADPEVEAEHVTPAPILPDHPAYQQILAVFSDVDNAGRSLRARDLCQALDLPIVAKHTENIRSKLKRLVRRGLLVETEPGLFTQPRP